MKSIKRMLILAALVLPWMPAWSQDAITNVMSPIVSYQYPDDFSSAALTNGGIMSPIDSYQYLEWPGDGILNLQFSPTVSYYYQFLTSFGSAVLHGRVTDTSGNPIPNAAIEVYLGASVTTLINADANGYYQIPSIGSSGVFSIVASASGYQGQMRGLTLNANTAEQDFQLKLMPSAPATQQVNRQSTVNYSVDAKGSRLLYFNGTVFTNIDANNAPSPNLMTIVLTHGWVIGTPDPSIMNTPFDRWPTNMAAQLVAGGITTSTANIVAWDWRYAATDSFPPSHAVDLTPDQGVALGEALTNYLGTGYSQPLHFIGHSLGTIVNAAAANFLHGDSNGNARRAASPIPWTSPMQMTLFDEAAIAEAIGDQALQTGLDPSALDAFNAAIGNSPPINGQSPLPNNYVWADNYESLVGTTLSGAVNVWLQKSSYPPTDLFDILSAIHGYPIDWYNNSIANPSDSKNPLGFQNSYEFDMKNGLSFAAPNTFQQGSVYQQLFTDSDPLALEAVTGVSQGLGLLPVSVIGGVENLWQDTVQIAGQVTVDVENTAQQTAQTITQGFNYVSGVAAQGGQAVVNFFNSAASMRVSLTTGPYTAVQQLNQGLVRPMGSPSPADSGGTASNTPAMVWLPIQFPANATAMAFDFTVSGDPMDDALVCGIGTNNLFSLQAKYIPTNQFSTSRLIDVSAWAGTTNELFFGFLGGTSTNATLQIQNIQFYSFQQPQLNIVPMNGAKLLAWPTTAAGYVIESTPSLTSPVWETTTNVPVIFGGSYIFTNYWSDQTRFFRLRSQ